LYYGRADLTDAWWQRWADRKRLATVSVIL